MIFACRRCATRIGIPQRSSRGTRSERALLCALAEMYVQGVSTRKVSAIVDKLAGVEVISMQVSRAAAGLDTELTAWREAKLPACAYLFLDACDEKVRHGGRVLDCAVLLAVGVTGEGKRRVLRVSVALSEAEAHWRAFLQSLHARGLKKARTAMLPSVPWQRCQFLLQQNAQAYVPRLEMRVEVGRTLRAVFTAPNRAETERLLKLAIATYEKTAPKLATWMGARAAARSTAWND